MTYEEALKMATARWAPAGATPEEIKDAVLKVLGSRKVLKASKKKYG